MAIAAPASGKYWESSNEVLRRSGSVEEGQIVTTNGKVYRGGPAEFDRSGVASLARESRAVALEIVEAGALCAALG